MRERGWWSDEEDEALRKGERKALLKALAQVMGGHGCMHQRLVCLLVRIGLWLTHELHLLSVAFCQAEKKPKPGMEDLFSDVYAEQPKLLKVCTLAVPLSAPLLSCDCSWRREEANACVLTPLDPLNGVPLCMCDRSKHKPCANTLPSTRMPTLRVTRVCRE